MGEYFYFEFQKHRIAIQTDLFFSGFVSYNEEFARFFPHVSVIATDLLSSEKWSEKDFVVHVMSFSRIHAVTGMFLSTILVDGLIFHLHTQLNDREMNKRDIESEIIL